MRSEPESTLRYYLTIIRRRRWVVLIGFVIPVAIAIVLTARATKMYQGSASVLINRRTLADEVTNSSDPTAATSDFLNIVQTDADAARSTQVADRVVRALPSAHLTGKELLSHSAVSPSQNSDVLSFTVQNRDPQLAEQLANAYASEFVAYEQQQDTSSFHAALNQIDARLAQARRARDQALINSLSSRDQQLRTLEALQTASNVVFNSSTQASLASPKRVTNIGLGIVGGVVLAILLAALREGLDTRVRTSEAAAALLGLPLLGRIGPPPKGFESSVLSLVDPSNVHAEGFRILRTNLELQTLRSDAKVLMVSSSVELEGKSVTIANIAVAAARAGRRTILVDLDLRQPTQDVLFAAAGRVPGVSDVLLGHVPLHEALLEIPLTGIAGEAELPGSLHLLRSGILPPDPGELTASEQLEALVNQLRSRADVIYIDCPPMLRAGDATAISRLTDAVFVVTRIPDARRSMLRELARVLARVPVPIAGFVATGRRSGESAYEYGYSYDRHARAKASERRQLPTDAPPRPGQPDVQSELQNGASTGSSAEEVTWVEAEETAHADEQVSERDPGPFAQDDARAHDDGHDMDNGDGSGDAHDEETSETEATMPVHQAEDAAAAVAPADEHVAPADAELAEDASRSQDRETQAPRAPNPSSGADRAMVTDFVRSRWAKRKD